MRSIERGRDRMHAFRCALSNRLVRYGTTLTLDGQEMWRKARQSGVRSLGSGDAQMFGTMELLSTVAIRLGRLVMPARPPDLTDLTGAGPDDGT